MVVDIQGCNYTMFDPEIASKEIQKALGFCTGNLSEAAIDTFITAHNCKVYCDLLNLPNAKSGWFIVKITNNAGHNIKSTSLIWGF